MYNSRTQSESSPDVVIIEPFRKSMPTHFLFKVVSFSLLSKHSVDRYESNKFEAGGYKWKLAFYPNGNKNEQGKDNISLYLMMVDTDSMPSGWELKVVFRLFLYDQIRDRYLIRGGIDGRPSRFHELKTTCGFPKFVSLACFSDPSNGYLIEDACVFGAEVFAYKSTGNSECLSMVKYPTTVNHIWRIEKFSEIKEQSIYSENFKAGDYLWNIQMYPSGCSGGDNRSLSLFLNLADSANCSTVRKVYAEFVLRIRDQRSNKHKEYKDNYGFCYPYGSLGCSSFIKLCDLNDEKNHLLEKDTLIADAEVKVLGVVSK